MNAESAAVRDESGIQTDLNRYKQAAEVAYRYAKTKAEEKNQQKEQSPFEEDKEETAQTKEEG